MLSRALFAEGTTTATISREDCTHSVSRILLESLGSGDLRPSLSLSLSSLSLSRRSFFLGLRLLLRLRLRSRRRFLSRS